MPTVTGLVMFDSHDLDSTKAVRGDEDKIGNNEGAGSNDNDGMSGDKGTNTQNVSLQQFLNKSTRLGSHYSASPLADWVINAIFLSFNL